MKIYRHFVTFSLALSLIFDSLAQTQKPAVKVYFDKERDRVEVRNLLAGIIVPRNNFHVKSQEKFLAPIQSFIYKNGTRSDGTPNYLESADKIIGASLKILKQTDEEVILFIRYDFHKKKYGGPSFKAAGSSEGPGVYSCRIVVKAAENIIEIEEDADTEVSYSVKISDGLNPDKARYRGWASTSAEYGYEVQGRKYRPENERGYPMDATVDLNFAKSTSYPGLYLWEPEGGEMNSGRYWQLYNSTDGAHSNIFGFFHGRPSRLIGANYATVNIETKQSGEHLNKSRMVELKMRVTRMAPDGRWYPRKRFQWVAFISTKTDILAPELTQPIAQKLNKLLNLVDIKSNNAKTAATLIPSFYKGAIYMNEEKVKHLRNWVKERRHFYNQLVINEGSYKAIWDMWRFPDSGKSMKQLLLRKADDFISVYTKGEGPYFSDFRYWKGARIFKYYTICISCVLADNTIEITNLEKNKLTNFVAMMAAVLANNDNVPLQNNAGVNLGTANMAIQYRNNGINFFLPILGHDARPKEVMKDLIVSVRNDIRQCIYENGSSFGTPHYTQAAIEPILFSILQLKQAGLIDFFRQEPRIKSFAKFYLSLLTPPSVRFARLRKLVSFGDGSEEGTAIFGLLARGFYDFDRDFSEQLLSVYDGEVAPSSFSGPATLAIGLVEKVKKKAVLKSCNYVGYHSGFRAGPENNETALWLINGDSLFDHRNDDAGEVAIYALGAPLSVSRSSFYYPHATDASVRSVVTPESDFPEWDKNDQPINRRSLTSRTWPKSELIFFANLGYTYTTMVRMSDKSGRQWYRQAAMIALDEQEPIFVFNDSLSGTNNNIWSLTMLSAGPARGTKEQLNATMRIHNNRHLQQLPAASNKIKNPAGWFNFFFTGQEWPVHYSKGVDWKFFGYSRLPTEVSLTSWSTTWQNQVEMEQFRKTNNRNYSEDLQILRVKSSGPFLNILLPFAKGADPYQDNYKTHENGEINISKKNSEIWINNGGCVIKEGNKKLLVLFGDMSTLAKEGFELSGGQLEVLVEAKVVKVRIHGVSGLRRIKIPLKMSNIINYREVQLQKINGETVIKIPYSNQGDDLSMGEKGYKEFIFEIEK